MPTPFYLYVCRRRTRSKKRVDERWEVYARSVEEAHELGMKHFKVDKRRPHLLKVEPVEEVANASSQ